ncbi:hypothetical protein Hypma_014660 [Hypsizygus marmoreus]|uniref:Uncharacterized protein n=1 Tax=Hypsizygus marmoreus TaxID=39966 RepID=A0A369JBY5_HYPMA|nr:hypothetical protein Hypma_014660 [Hypsizygus marmoreus]
MRTSPRPSRLAVPNNDENTHRLQGDLICHTQRGLRGRPRHPTSPPPPHLKASDEEQGSISTAELTPLGIDVTTRSHGK